MDTTWIVSADTGRARIFSESDPTAPLQEVEDMVNTETRMRKSEVYADKLGPTAAGKSIHNTGGALPNKQYEAPQTPDEREAESFAKDISAYLLSAKREGRFDKLALVAAPRFLGALRMFMDPQLTPLIRYEIDKDYTSANAQQLREQIRAHQNKA